MNLIVASKRIAFSPTIEIFITQQWLFSTRQCLLPLKRLMSRPLSNTLEDIRVAVERRWVV